MKNVLLFEPNATGHRLPYLRHILAGLLRETDFGIHLLVASDALDDHDLRSLMRRDESRVHATTASPFELNNNRLPSKLARISHQMRCLSSIRSYLEATRTVGSVDCVFVPFVDEHLHFALAMRRPPFVGVRWGGIAIRPRIHLSAMGLKVRPRLIDRIERFAYQRMLSDRSMVSLFSIDPLFCQHVGSSKVHYVADPADLVTTASAEKGPSIPELPPKNGAVVILVYGSIDQRKGLAELLALASAGPKPADVILLIAGRQNDQARAILQSACARALREKGRLWEIPRQITDAEERVLFKYTDLVWAFYPGSYCSSGAVIRAAQAMKPIITTREGLVGYWVDRYEMGIAAPESHPMQLDTPLRSLIESEALRIRMGAAGFEHFKGATSDSFGSRIARQLAADLAS